MAISIVVAVTLIPMIAETAANITATQEQITELAEEVSSIDTGATNIKESSPGGITYFSIFMLLVIVSLIIVWKRNRVIKEREQTEWARVTHRPDLMPKPARLKIFGIKIR